MLSVQNRIMLLSNPKQEDSELVVRYRNDEPAV